MLVLVLVRVLVLVLVPAMKQIAYFTRRPRNPSPEADTSIEKEYG